jgi:hypothetical protein
MSSASVSQSSAASAASDDDRLLADEESPLERSDAARQSYRHPDLPPTTQLAKELSIVRNMLQWNFRVRDACCPYHAGLKLVLSSARRMSKDRCMLQNLSQVPERESCKSCGLLICEDEVLGSVCRHCEGVPGLLGATLRSLHKRHLPLSL